MREEVVERGPPRVGHSAFLQQCIVVGDGDLSKVRLAGKCLGEMGIDLCEQSREIPSCDVFSRCLGCRGALHETPAILLKILPVPVGKDRLHCRHHFLRCLCELRLHARDFLLRLVSFDFPFERDSPRDRLGRLRPCLVGQCSLHDGCEFFDRGFRQALRLGIRDLLPERVPLSRMEREREKDDGGKSREECARFHLL